jgi:hypothetical protein
MNLEKSGFAASGHPDVKRLFTIEGVDGVRPRLPAAGRGQQAVDVDRGRAGPPEAKLGENVDEARCLAPRADGDEVGDLARETVCSPPDCCPHLGGAAMAMADPCARIYPVSVFFVYGVIYGRRHTM